MKRPFLVVHDYGMGGIWAYIWAESSEQITSSLDLQVMADPPNWIIGQEPGVVSLDIDGPLPGWPRRSPEP